MGRGGEVAAIAGYWNAATFDGREPDAAFRRSLGEGATPLEPFASLPVILLKREDANPTGSHKDRAAAYQLAVAAERGVPAVTISSSGNAAIATSRYAELHGIEAVVFVHPETDPAKLAAIDGATTTVVLTTRAINGARMLSRELRIPNLRPSTSPEAVVGYRSLGDELVAALDADPDAFDTVVMFATSGATALAVAEQLTASEHEVEVHVVQGEGNAALVAPDADVSDASAHGAAAGRLGVRRSPRGKAMLAAVAATGGSGHVATAADVAAARMHAHLHGLELSDESAANLAVSFRLADAGRQVVCVISGAPAPSPSGSTRADTLTADDEHDALEQVRARLSRIGQLQ